MTVKLYYAPGACSFASHIALEEVAIPYDTVRLNLAEGDQRKPGYLEINPRGRVPALVVDGKILTENVGIMAYIAGGYGQGKIWPRDTWLQAKCLSSMVWLSNTVHPSYARYFRTERFIEGAEHVQALKTKALADFNDCLGEIDRLLEGHRWSIGERSAAPGGGVSPGLGRGTAAS